MAYAIVSQVIETLSDVMNFMAPNAGGAVPDSTSVEYTQWRISIQVKQEEAARRGFWRRLLTKDIISLRTGDTEVTLPTRFQRANALYILGVGGVDLGDPDRIREIGDTQTAVPQMINDPEDEEFGLWKIIFSTPIEADEESVIWYWATPPKPVDATDKILLPGDMVAFGALSEIFRSTNLAGSQDDARQEYENRLATYLAIEMIPARNELLTFDTNPRRINRTRLARKQYMIRPDRLYRG